MNAPMPAKVAWHSESCPAIPVINVTERRTVERARPELKTPAQVIGIQVSMETQKPANSAHHPTRMMRSMLGALVVAAIGGGGGSMVARGSRLVSRSRMPGSSRSAATMTRNGSAGTTAALTMLLGGM